jgi:hypothetical protein
MKKKNIRTILTHRWFLIQFFVRLDSLSFWELPSCSSSNLAQDSIYNSTIICRCFGLYDYLAQWGITTTTVCIIILTGLLCILRYFSKSSEVSIRFEVCITFTYIPLPIFTSDELVMSRENSKNFTYAFCKSGALHSIRHSALLVDELELNLAHDFLLGEPS